MGRHASQQRRLQPLWRTGGARRAERSAPPRPTGHSRRRAVRSTRPRCVPAPRSKCGPRLMPPSDRGGSMRPP